MKELMGLLEQLNIHPHKNLRSLSSGSIGRSIPGNSDDFLKYKGYETGDALNQIDWKRYTKTKKLYTKQFGNQRDFTIALAIDTSSSMKDDLNEKIAYQEEIVKAIAYSSLYHQHSVILIDLANEVHFKLSKSLNSALAQVDEWLNSRLYDAKNIPFTSSYFEQFSSVLFITITDGWMANFDSFVDQQMVMKNDFILIQLLLENELSPTYKSNCQLVDRESSEEVVLKITPQLLARYHELLTLKLNSIRNQCNKYGFRYFRATTTEPLKPLLIGLGR